jgi:hypothetical protein
MIREKSLSAFDPPFVARGRASGRVGSLPDSRSESLLPRAPFRGLQRVEFLFFLDDCAFEMSGEVAGAAVPLVGGFWHYGTEDALGEVLCPGATLALIDDRIAPAAVEGATFSGHERTLGAVLHGYALHGSFLLGDTGVGHSVPSHYNLQL